MADILPGRGRDVTSDEVKMMRRLRLEGKLIKQVAFIVGRNIKTVSTYTCDIGRRRRRNTKVDHDMMWRMLAAGISPNKIGKYFGVSGSTIRHHRIRWLNEKPEGVVLPPRKKGRSKVKRPWQQSRWEQELQHDTRRSRQAGNENVERRSDVA